jgi:hypothetical protein
VRRERRHSALRGAAQVLIRIKSHWNTNQSTHAALA